jgi:hypothetical protein
MVSNLALFCLATVLVTFQKIGLFFPNHLVTLVVSQMCGATPQAYCKASPTM